MSGASVGHGIRENVLVIMVPRREAEILVSDEVKEIPSTLDPKFSYAGRKERRK